MQQDRLFGRTNYSGRNSPPVLPVLPVLFGVCDSFTRGRSCSAWTQYSRAVRRRCVPTCIVTCACYCHKRSQGERVRTELQETKRNSAGAFISSKKREIESFLNHTSAGSRDQNGTQIHSGLLEGLGSAVAGTLLVGLPSLASGCRHAICGGKG